VIHSGDWEKVDPRDAKLMALTPELSLLRQQFLRAMQRMERISLEVSNHGTQQKREPS